ncbi:hypothetical protein NQ318_021009 [Aromia moschata]|uniref:Ras-GAP domain-containing protein n=1 Tax=Aromia moschata TaxID=1265417 RepID=A0AAV8YP44_9CUCU|nr:hypothetical protein NQ318_021009 [Aromia moschata]
MIAFTSASYEKGQIEVRQQIRSNSLRIEDLENHTSQCQLVQVTSQPSYPITLKHHDPNIWGVPRPRKPLSNNFGSISKQIFPKIVDDPHNQDFLVPRYMYEFLDHIRDQRPQKPPSNQIHCIYIKNSRKSPGDDLDNQATLAFKYIGEFFQHQNRVQRPRKPPRKHFGSISKEISRKKLWMTLTTRTSWSPGTLYGFSDIIFVISDPENPRNINMKDNLENEESVARNAAPIFKIGTKLSRVETPRYISLRTYLEASGPIPEPSGKSRDLSTRALPAYVIDVQLAGSSKQAGADWPSNSIKVGNLLQVLRSHPAQLAKWLVVGEQMAEETQSYSLVLQSIVVGLYGCFIFPEDTKFMLTLLYELAKLQLLNSDNPRRFHQNDGEIVSIFKDAGEYRREVVAKLVEVSNTFITALLENVYSFPKSISWIVCHISKIIEKSFGAKEANSIVTELIFTLYICPVIVDPEQYGICNAQVTDIARHNLIQIGQILQSLALNKFEPTDPKCSDLFDLLNKTRVSNFVELLFFDMENEEPPIDSSPVAARDIMLFTEHELNHLISILQRIQAIPRQNDNFVKEDETIEDQLLSLSLSSRDNSPKSSRLTASEETTVRKTNFFSLGSKNHITRSASDEIKNHSNVVLAFPIEQVQTDPIGLLPEDKIVDLSIPVKSSEIFESVPSKLDASMSDTPNQNGDIKQTFNFQDEGSIGNTSDNLEAISEAASNHSVDSSIELENEDQNDNLSDMVSANVPGRGTPNISGRDTPSSQVCDNDDRVMAEARQIDVPQPQPNLSRQIRSEIDDKFCKFEIKKLLEGDETISIISETWSTDVLASDNETVDAGNPGTKGKACNSSIRQFRRYR